MVRFGIHPLQRNEQLAMICEAEVVDERIITDSGGHREPRLVIETEITLLGKTWPIEMTLTNRDTMKFRMLLGRTALTDQFLVDPKASFIGGRELRSVYRKGIE